MPSPVVLEVPSRYPLMMNLEVANRVESYQHSIYAHYVLQTLSITIGSLMSSYTEPYMLYHGR
jgi:hypothetical protein